MKLLHLGVSAILLLSSITVNADVLEDVVTLQTRWAEVNYTMTEKAQKEAFEDLIKQADKVVSNYPESAESYIWRGIIKSSYAGAKGGLGAMSLAKASKVDLEKAISIDEQALSGSALTSLGTLYFKVPGWPIGFGNNDKAKTLLEKALAINPDGIDSNYFYAEFLADQRQYDKAEQYLLKAQKAPSRTNRPLADKGRQQEISASLVTIRQKVNNKQNASIIN